VKPIVVGKENQMSQFHRHTEGSSYSTLLAGPCGCNSHTIVVLKWIQVQEFYGSLWDF